MAAIVAEPLKKKSLADDIEERLLAFIREQHLSPGDTLPGEEELAGSFGVSRHVVREALSRLRMLGIIQSRPRRGIVVTQPDVLGGISRMIEPSLIDAKTACDLFELRLVLELGLAEVVMARITAEDIAELEKMAAQEPELLDSWDALVQLETDFHGRLFRVTGNEILARLQSVLALFFRLRQAHPSAKARRKDFPHSRLVAALKSGCVETFRDELHQHFKPAIEVMRKRAYEQILTVPDQPEPEPSDTM